MSITSDLPEVGLRARRCIAWRLPLAMAIFALGGGFMYSYYPAFWSMPTMILSESAAATFGLINGLGHLGGFFGPYIIGDLNTRTGSFLLGFAFIGCCYLLVAFLVVRLKLPKPMLDSMVGVPQPRTAEAQT